MFGKEEKEGRKDALKKLMDVMGGETSKKLHGLKKPPMASSDDEPEVEVEIEEEPSGDEPSEDDKAMIRELYMKFCR